MSEELVIGELRGYQAFKMLKWALQEFREYGADSDNIVDALRVVSRDRWYYKNEQKMLKGVRDYLHEVVGLKIPLRLGKYKEMEE
jgi:hypothetical protein